MATFVKWVFFIFACLATQAAIELWADFDALGRRQMVTDIFFLVFAAGVIDALQSKDGKK